MHCRSPFSLALSQVVAMTTHLNSRHLTRAFPYTSGQEAVWRPWDPREGRKWGNPIPSWEPSPPLVRLLSCSGKAGTLSLEFPLFHPSSLWEKQDASVVISPKFFLLKQAKWLKSSILDDLNIQPESKGRYPRSLYEERGAIFCLQPRIWHWRTRQEVKSRCG